MTNPPVVVTRRLDHLLIEGTWIDYGNPNEHEPLNVPWALRVPTLRHRDHLAYVLRHPGVEPMLDPAELEMNGVEDARNLMHLNWWEGAHDEACELQTTAAVQLAQQPWSGTVTLHCWLENQDRLGLARLTLVEAIDVADRVMQADASGLPDGEWVVAAPWFPNAADIREFAKSLADRVAADASDNGRGPASASQSMEPSADPWAHPLHEPTEGSR